MKGRTAAEIVAEIVTKIDDVSGISHQIESMTARELMETDIPEAKWVVPDLIPQVGLQSLRVMPRSENRSLLGISLYP